MEQNGNHGHRPAITRLLLLLCGGVGLGLLATWIRWLGRSGGSFVLTESDWRLGELSLPCVGLAVAGAGLGLVGLILALRNDPLCRGTLRWLGSWLREHPGQALLMLLVMALGAADVYQFFYDPFSKKAGRYPYVLRDDLQMWLLWATAIAGALALSAGLGAERLRQGACRLERMLGQRRRVGWWATMFLLPLILGAAMCALALEGIPHFSDSLTYLMQGRVLWSGALWLPAPLHPDLWIGSLFFVTDQQHVDPATKQMVYEGTRFFGKYPLGWPAILGTFDHFGLRVLANASLIGLAGVLTGLTARQFASRRVAVLAGLLFAFMPWAWFNGAHFAAHVASTCALLGFVWLYLRTANTLHGAGLSRRSAWFTALGAGLCLGMAVLIRPGDAANFALPVGVMTLWFMLRQPGRWLPAALLLALGLGVGVAIYFGSNAQTVGHPLKSPYTLEARWSDDWHPTLASMAGRFIFQWQQLNAKVPGWGIGGMTVATAGLLLVGRQSRRIGGHGARRRLNGLWLLLACTAVFFLFNTAFGFTNVWWGPRWLLPVTPAVAILGAYVVQAMLHQARQAGAAPPAQAARLGVALLLAGTVFAGAWRYGGQWWMHKLMPPHFVSGLVAQEVRARGITQAVVALPNMPVDLADRGGRCWLPIDARAGMVMMDMPLGQNGVIYVRAIPAWIAKARASFPARRLYEVIPGPKDRYVFEIREIKPSDGPAGQ